MAELRTELRRLLRDMLLGLAMRVDPDTRVAMMIVVEQRLEAWGTRIEAAVARQRAQRGNGR